MRFLSYNGPLMTGFRKALDYYLLGIMWFFVSLPLITFGAATTAMFYTAEKSIHKDGGKVFSTFWKCFRQEFRQSTVLGLVALIAYAAVVYNAIILWNIDLPGIVFSLVLITSILILGWISLWFGYLSRFNDTTRTLLSNTFRFIFARMPWVALLTVITASAIAGAIISFLYSPVLLFFVPGLYAAIANIVICKIFAPYIAEECQPGLEDAGIAESTIY